MVSSAIFLAFGVLGNEITWTVVWLALALFAIGTAESPTWTAVVEFGGRRGGTAAAILNTGGNLGGLLAPMVTPIVSHAVRDAFHLSDLAGWQCGILLAGVICLLGATLWGWIRTNDTGPQMNTD
jgi:sugar phosphate permease